MNSVCMKYKGTSKTLHTLEVFVNASVTFSTYEHKVPKFWFNIFTSFFVPYIFLSSLYITGCLSHSQICHQQSQASLLEFALLTSITQWPVGTASGSHIGDIVTNLWQKWKDGPRLLQTASNMVSLSCYTSVIKLYRVQKLKPFILFRWSTGQYRRSIRARIYPKQCENVWRRFPCILDWTV